MKPEIYGGIFLKDPERSELGKRILKEGVSLIDKIGFEAFTFKKLGERINQMKAQSIGILRISINYCFTFHHGIGAG